MAWKRALSHTHTHTVDYKRAEMYTDLMHAGYINTISETLQTVNLKG